MSQPSAYPAHPVLLQRTVGDFDDTSLTLLDLTVANCDEKELIYQGELGIS